MKMKGVYESNPALGDPMTIESQLRENTQRLEKLRAELHKYQRCVLPLTVTGLPGRGWDLGSDCGVGTGP